MRWYLVLLLLVACSPVMKFNEHSFDVEIADSPDELTQGLMFRESMPDDHGMLFVFPDSAKRTFWMKDTLIPLDIIFLDDSFTVINVEHALPCEADPCPHYESAALSKYVLEINGGLAEKLKINSGSKFSYE